MKLFNINNLSKDVKDKMDPFPGFTTSFLLAMTVGGPKGSQKNEKITLYGQLIQWITEMASILRSEAAHQGARPMIK